VRGGDTSILWCVFSCSFSLMKKNQKIKKFLSYPTHWLRCPQNFQAGAQGFQRRFLWVQGYLFFVCCLLFFVPNRGVYPDYSGLSGLIRPSFFSSLHSCKSGLIEFVVPNRKLSGLISRMGGISATIKFQFASLLKDESH
jgi:hypothetical protein